MRKTSGATVAMIMGVALYFTVFWGLDAIRVLTSPTFGLDDVWRSQFVFGIGSHFALAPTGLLKLAAFFGAVKLVVAFVCAIHLATRVRALAGGKANSEVFEGGLMVVVAVSIVSAGPAAWVHNTDLVRGQIIQLALAALGVALCMVERSYDRSRTVTEARLAASTHNEASAPQLPA